MKNFDCPLCLNPTPQLLLEKYIHCGDCDLISLLPSFRLPPELEKQRYLLHQGQNPDGLTQFLRPALSYVERNLSTKSKILDYGCGADQVLVKYLNHRGYTVEGYDPFFFPKALTPNIQRFDAVIATEVVEHFFEPRDQFAKLVDLLLAEGELILMTSLHQGGAHFKDWSYRRDPTHVSFYSEKTMAWIAKQFNIRLVKQGELNLIVFKKFSLNPLA